MYELVPTVREGYFICKGQVILLASRLTFGHHLPPPRPITVFASTNYSNNALRMQSKTFSIYQETNGKYCV